MLQKLYKFVLNLAGHRHAERWLALVAFLESSLFPIPPDVMLVPMAVAERSKALRYGVVASMFSVLGAFLGYAIGYYFWEFIGAPLIDFYGFQDAFGRFQAEFEARGVLIVFIFGLTFFPFKVITIASGFLGFNLPLFALACLASRTPRFMIEAAILWKWGEQVQSFVERRLALIVSLATILLVGGFVALKFI